MTTEMSDYVPVYDNVGRNKHATSAFTSDVAYAKLSPDTLLKKRSASEQYQAPVTEHGKRHQKRSGLFIATASVLFTLLTVGTITAVILASIEFQHVTQLSIKNIELSTENSQLSHELTNVKEEVINLQEMLKQMSFNKCYQDTMACVINSDRIRSKIKPFCETEPLPFNITVS